MGNDLKWAIASDVHIPYHNPRYLDLWFKFLKYFKPDVVDYLGDIDDQACFSRFNDGTPEEVLGRVSTYAPDVKKFYSDTRDLLPKAEMFVALGNHDIRIFDYIDKKAPALRDSVTPESMWGLDDLGYDYIYYSDRPKHRFGDIHVHHGNKVSKHSAESVRNDMDDFGVSLMRGHSHRQGVYMKTWPMRNETLRGYEIGHLTDVESPGMGYSNVHNWQAGFALAHIEQGKYPHIQLVTISPDYTAYINGRRFVC
jgi:predicted phosphodiesterase